MIRRHVVSAILAGMLVAACGSSGGGTAAPAEPSSTTTANAGAVTHVQLDLVDRSRPAVDPAGERSAPARTLPTELYLPPGTGRVPLVVFAHGFGGDPSKFDQLFTSWADAGFAVAAPRFPITFTGADSRTLGRAGDFVQQPGDLTFVLDEVLASTYGPRFDRRRIGAAGLSLGGVTTWGWVTNSCCRDPRPRAAIIMDGDRFDYPDGTYGPNQVPVLVFHADADPALDYEHARRAYADAVPPKYFVTMFGVLHAQPFEDSPSPADAMVTRTTIDFWKGWLLGERAARARITSDGTVPDVSTAESSTS